MTPGMKDAGAMSDIVADGRIGAPRLFVLSSQAEMEDVHGGGDSPFLHWLRSSWDGPSEPRPLLVHACCSSSLPCSDEAVRPLVGSWPIPTSGSVPLVDDGIQPWMTEPAMFRKGMYCASRGRQRQQSKAASHRATSDINWPRSCMRMGRDRTWGKTCLSYYYYTRQLV
jgi:hypothetical protein